MQQAIRDFSLDDGPDMDQTASMMFGPWLLYHMPISETDPMPIASRYREAARLHREPAKERVLNARLDAPIGIWEVQSIERGVGTQVRDLLSGDERFIYDSASSQTLELWLSILAYVVECDGVCFQGGLHYQPQPPMYVEGVVRAMRNAAHVRTRPVPLEFHVNPFRQIDLIDRWRDAIESMREIDDHRIVTNTDSDEISIHSDLFDVILSREEILQRLATISGAEPLEHDGTNSIIAVLRDSRAGALSDAPTASATMGLTVVGSIVLSGSRLAADTNSIKRGDALKSAIERAARNAVRFPLRSTKSLEALKARARSPGLGGPTSPPPGAGNVFTGESTDMPPEVREALRQMMAKLDAQGIDSTIPVLDNVTAPAPEWGWLSRRSGGRWGIGAHSARVRALCGRGNGYFMYGKPTFRILVKRMCIADRRSRCWRHLFSPTSCARNA